MNLVSCLYLTGLTCLFMSSNGQIHLIDNNDITPTDSSQELNSCTFTIVESIPENLTFASNEPLQMSTYSAHKRLLARATKSIHLTSFYWTLLGSDTEVYDYSSFQGEDIFSDLFNIVSNGTIDVKIVQNITSNNTDQLAAGNNTDQLAAGNNTDQLAAGNNTDQLAAGNNTDQLAAGNNTDQLAAAGAQVRTVNFQKLLHAGVLHTKMWVVDNLHVYIGSANFDWRSYTQVKELGVLIEDCPTLASDAEKLFQVYWYFSYLSDSNLTSASLSAFDTSINATNPHQVQYNQTKALVYLASSPPLFCPVSRTGDIDAIVSVIRAAKEFIYISVMDYIPMIIYSTPQVYWPIIDEELRKAAINNKVSVRLLASKWSHTKRDMYAFLNSLNVLHNATKVNIHVKLFTVPAYTGLQRHIPFSRVSHSKYMVTDQHAYIGTSNWSGDYFVNTGGVGFILQESGANNVSVRVQLIQIFDRDWNSSFSRDVY